MYHNKAIFEFMSGIYCTCTCKVCYDNRLFIKWEFQLKSVLTPKDMKNLEGLSFPRVILVPH